MLSNSKNVDIDAFNDQNEQLRLFLLTEFLNRAVDDEFSNNLFIYDLFDSIIDFNAFAIEINRLIREKFALIDDSQFVAIDWNKFNANQLKIANTIVETIMKNKFELDQFFFLDDSEKTEKIFVQNIVMIKLRAIEFQNESIIVFAIIFSDIAITFLDDDFIAHSRFKISLNIIEKNTCNIKKNNNRCEFIRKIKLIFWNEIFMQRKWNFMIVNKIFFDFCDVDEIIVFEKKIVCFCENFKQCLSVVVNKSRNIVINMNFQKFFFWRQMNILFLIINMRLQNLSLNDQDRQKAIEFARDVLDIDNAMITKNNKMISWKHDYLFFKNSQIDLIDIIYSDFHIRTFSNQYFSERAILIVVNIDVLHINDVCIDKFRKSLQLKHNVNILVDSNLKKKFDDECFHRYNEISFSFHTLRLKIDMFIMIFRNLKSSIKCNDIRTRITRINQHVLEIEIVDDKKKNFKIVISRISLQSKNDEFNKNRRAIVFCQFIKRQFSIRFAFAMTINKSQKQFLKYVDVNIQIRNCFTHDQLYVAFFKVTKKWNFHIIVSEMNVLFENFVKEIKNVQWKKIFLF